MLRLCNPSFIQRVLNHSTRWIRPTQGLIILLTLGLLISAQFLIHWSHATRQQQFRLQVLHSERDALQIEWGRLLLEESALVSPIRLEQQAALHLQLKLPERGDLRIELFPAQPRML